MKPIAIYGAGGLGRETLSLLQSLPEWSPVGFYDDVVPRGTHVAGLPVIGGIAEIKKVDNLNIVIAIGDPRVKEQILQKLGDARVSYPTLIHPSAILQNKSGIQLGVGAIVTAGCILTTDIRIGNHVLLNLNATIGHDVFIDDYVSIMPGVNLAGQVHVGKSVLIGSGVQVINRCHIGEHAIIGSGAVVIKNVPPNITVVGVPARAVKK